MPRLGDRHDAASLQRWWCACASVRPLRLLASRRYRCLQVVCASSLMQCKPASSMIYMRGLGL